MAGKQKDTGVLCNDVEFPGALLVSAQGITQNSQEETHKNNKLFVLFYFNTGLIRKLPTVLGKLKSMPDIFPNFFFTG